MPFQFLCPQGHLLQGDESQMGLQTQCPLCGVAFIIPHVAPQPAQQYPQQPPGQPGGYAPQPQYPQQQYAPQPQQQYAPQQYPQQPAYSPPAPQPQAQAPAYQPPPEPAPQPPAQQQKKRRRPPEPKPEPELGPSKDLSDELGGDISGPGGLGAMADLDAAVFHIPCPNGHELETPIDMIGEEALCPHCGVQFKLLEKNSLEFLQRQEIIDRQRAHFWFNWAIAAAVVVGIMLLAMLIVALRS